jgi:hypothetical protein
VSPNEDRTDQLLRRFRDLPRYQVDGWPGRRSFDDAGGGQIPVTRGDITLWAISAGVQHTNATRASIVVMSHNRVPNRDLGRRQWWAVNAIMQGSQDFGLPPIERTEQLKRDIALEQEAERLKGLANHGQLACRSEMIPVDKVPIPFQVYEVEGGRPYPGEPTRRPLWAAFGRLPEVDVALDSWGVPLAGLALARVTTPIPPPSWLESRRRKPPPEAT